MGADMVPQGLAHLLAARAQPEAARMQRDLQIRDPGRGLEQGGGAIAPATEGVINIVQCDVVHLRAPRQLIKKPGNQCPAKKHREKDSGHHHFISPMLTLAPITRPSSTGRDGNAFFRPSIS
ncbi:hypothetical protein D3C80_1529630 [compost metagenome]